VRNRGGDIKRDKRLAIIEKAKIKNLNYIYISSGTMSSDLIYSVKKN
jgi:hypothetical protein